MQDVKGVVIVKDVMDLTNVASKTNTPIYVLPSRLRMVRTAFGDNGFSGVRVVTSQEQFLRDVEMEAKMEAIMEAGINPHEADPEVMASLEYSTPAFGKLEPGQYATVSPGQKMKYLVCHPDHRWAATVYGGIVHLLPVDLSDEKMTKALKPYAVIHTDFASFV